MPITIEIDKDGEPKRVDQPKKAELKKGENRCLHEKVCKQLTIKEERWYCLSCNGAVFDLDECPIGNWYIPERFAAELVHRSWYDTNKRKHLEACHGKNSLD